MKNNLILAALLSAAIPGTAQKTLYVAPGGSASNPGTLAAPLSSPADAWQRLRGQSGDATIYCRGGYYPFAQSCVLLDSADTARHITIAAYNGEKVVFSGGVPLKGSAFKPVTDAGILARLPAEARGHVYQASLTAAGIQNLGSSYKHGYKTSLPANLELFYNDKALPIARWPKTGLTPIGQVLDPGSNPRAGDKAGKGATFRIDDDRILRWAKADHAWVSGSLSLGYNDDHLKVAAVDPGNHTLKLADAGDYGVFATNDTSNAVLKNARTLRGIYIYNLLEEISEPGDWYADPDSGILYVWFPDASFAQADIEVSLMENPIMVLSYTSNVTLRGLTFGYSRGMGLFINNTRNTVVEGCAFTDLGTVGLSTYKQYLPVNNHYWTGPTPNIPYTTNLLVDHCTFTGTGTGAVFIDGGNRATLAPANNTVTNCEFSHYSRIDRTFTPAVYLNGVGNHVTHCYIHDAPDLAVLYYGNQLDISYNHIKNVAENVTDAGAVCTGRDFSTTGNTIAYNFFEDIGNTADKSVCAIYLDDCTSGMQVTGNVFYRCGSTGTYHFGAVHVNGGSNNVFRNNYFIDCGTAFSNTRWSDQQYKALVSGPYNASADIHSPAFMKRYPYIAALTDPAHLPVPKNFTYNTLLYKTGAFGTPPTFVNQNTVTLSSDPGFADAAAGNFELKVTPPPFKGVADWQPVPFSQIGLK